MQRDCTCACAVARLRPHNSISNVVVSVTIHDDMFFNMYVFVGDVCKKNMKPLWNVRGFFNRTPWKVSDVQIVRYTWVLVASDTSNHPVAHSLRSVRSLEESGTCLCLSSAQNVKVMKSQTSVGERPSRLSLKVTKLSLPPSPSSRRLFSLRFHLPFSLCLCLSLSLSPCDVALVLCLVCVCACVCPCVLGTVCTFKRPSVSRFNTSPCVPASRTNVPLGSTSQRLLLQAQVRLHITMQHVYSHG